MASKNILIPLYLAALLFAVAIPFFPLVTPIIVGITFLVFISLYTLKRINFNHIAIPILALTSIPHSLISSGVNISVSDVYLVFAALLLLVMTKGKVKVPKGYTIIILLYSAWSLLSMFWASEPTLAFIRSLQIIEFALVSVIVFYNIDSTNTLKKTIYTYIIFSVSLSFVAIVMYLANGIGGPLYILGFHKNALGAIIGYSLPMIAGILYLEKRTPLLNFLFIVAFSVNGLALLMTFSRGAILGAVVSIFVLLFFINKKRHLIFLASMIGVLFLLFFTVIAPELFERFTDFGEGSSAYSRIWIYEDAATKISEHPFIGSGVGNYFIWLPQINFQQDDPNNIFLLHLVESGVIGLLLFVVMLLYIVRFAFKNKKTFKADKEFLVLNAIFISGFIARLVHTQFDVTWVRGPGLFMFAMIGMMFALNRMYLKKQKDAI